MQEDERTPYEITQQGDAYHVVDQAGNLVCACGGKLNAQHYATILNQAYQRGYKAGYHAAKSTTADQGQTRH